MSILNETNPKYQEIIKLHMLLEDACIPHVLREHFDGWQVCYPSAYMSEVVAEVAEFFGSYGAEKDLLELMGLMTEKEFEEYSFLGYLSADEVFRRMSEHYNEVTNHDEKH